MKIKVGPELISCAGWLILIAAVVICCMYGCNNQHDTRINEEPMTVQERNDAAIDMMIDVVNQFYIL